MQQMEFGKVTLEYVSKVLGWLEVTEVEDKARMLKMAGILSFVDGGEVRELTEPDGEDGGIPVDNEGMGTLHFEDLDLTLMYCLTSSEKAKYSGYTNPVSSLCEDNKAIWSSQWPTT